MKKDNLQWINYMRGICMILIYFVHCLSYTENSVPVLSSLIHPIYVNSFFFVSGYLFYRKQFSKMIICKSRREFLKIDGSLALKNILFRMIFPTLLFSLIEFFPSFLLRGNSIDVLIFVDKTLGGGTYWFISALVVIQIIALFLVTIIRKDVLYPHLLVAIVLFVISKMIIASGYVLYGRDASFPWAYREAFLAFVFFVFGGIYWRYETYIDNYMSIPIFGGLLFTYIYLVKTLGAHITLISTLSINGYGVIISFVGIIILLYLCKLLRNNLILDAIGKNTLGFYYFSGAFPIVLNVLARKIGINGLCTRFLIVFVFSFGFAGSIVWLMNRHFSFVFDCRDAFRKKR